MLGFKDRNQPELFVTGSLRQLLPDDHVLVRVDRTLELSWLRAEVAERAGRFSAGVTGAGLRTRLSTAL